ncbi:MAG: Heat shock protein [Deinococcota bacterium]|jgi:hypothetical protein
MPHEIVCFLVRTKSMRWQAFRYQGQLIDLSHLDGFDHSFIQPNEDGKPERLYRTRVTFSHHCFTENSKPEDDPKLLYPSTQDLRSFDQRRYQLSKHLPEIILTLMNRTISHTEHSNFVTFELLNEAGISVEYNVFFEVKRAVGDKRLHLIVQSAFPRDEDRNSNRPRHNKIRFATILFNVQNNKPIKPKR